MIWILIFKNYVYSISQISRVKVVISNYSSKENGDKSFTYLNGARKIS